MLFFPLYILKLKVVTQIITERENKCESDTLKVWYLMTLFSWESDENEYESDT